MPAYFRVHIDGTLAGGAERWSTSVAVSDTGGAVPPTASNVAAAAQAIYDAFTPTTGWPSTLKALISATGTITKIRVYWYPNIGQEAQVAGESVGAAIAGNSTASLPTQCSLVFSLRSGISGRSFRGRMYWPIQNSAFVQGQAQAVSATTASAVVNMLGAIRTVPQFGDSSQIVVVSEVKGELTPVSRVVIDNLVDTQRRRRDALVGTQFAQNLL